MMNRKRKNILADEIVDDLLELEDASESIQILEQDKEILSKDPGIRESFKKMIQMKKKSSRTLAKSREEGAVESLDEVEVGLAKENKSHAQKNKSLESELRDSDNMSVAQKRILDLEKDLDELRIENEKTQVAAEILYKKNQQLISENEAGVSKYSRQIDGMKTESQLLKESLDHKNRVIHDLELKNEEFDSHFNSRIQKIRTRERDLENKNEILKKESEVLLRSKNDNILALNRQIDQLKVELENFRKKGAKLNKQIREKKNL